MKRMAKAFPAVVVLLSTLSGAQAQVSATDTMIPNDLLLCRAVFNWLFLKHPSGIPDDDYFLTVRGEDPPAQFLEGLVANGHRIRPGSQFVRQGPREANGVLLSIDEIIYDSRYSAHAVWTLDGGKKWHAKARVDLFRQGSYWRVTSESERVVE